MSQQITEAQFDHICSEARIDPVSFSVITDDTSHSPEVDYLFTVCSEIRARVGEEFLHSKSDDSVSDAHWLRNSIRRLLKDNKAESFDENQIVDKYLPSEKDDQS